MICRICNKYKSKDQMVINHTTPVKIHYKDICKSCSQKKNKTVNNLKKIHPYPADDYCCPICNKSVSKYYLDHDWKTGEFRGWLCNACNVSLGLFKDDVNILNRAIEYLQNQTFEGV